MKTSQGKHLVRGVARVEGETKEPRGRQRDAAGRELRIRHELVERVRREIAAGTYETPAKWEQALDKLFERLMEE
jgi:hypothetical protein